MDRQVGNKEVEGSPRGVFVCLYLNNIFSRSPRRSLWHTKEKALMFGRLLLPHLKGLKKDMKEKKIRKLSEEEVVMKIAAVVEKVSRIS